MQIYYLEIVSSDVDSTCQALAEAHGAEFGPELADLGHARTIELQGGGMIGVRAPMGDTEEPVVRTYLRINDMETAVAKVASLGATIAHPPMEIPGRGQFAIYLLNGIQHGFWQI